MHGMENVDDENTILALPEDSCPICNEKMADKEIGVLQNGDYITLLSMHLEKKHQKHLCQICKKIFDTAQYLKNHIKFIHR